tara:strand:- start:3751 stop:4647 length:897 start_codon:yes stop_codon:yes gene_type:complete
MTSYEGLNILITGSTGYIGSTLVKSFNSIDCNLIISTGDVSKKETWNDIIKDDIDIIFHLAAVEVEHETPERDLNVNSVSVLHMLQTCVEKRCNPKIIFASSTNVFGIVNEDKVNENTNAKPAAEWSAHKLLSEHYLKIYNEKFGLKSIILRLPNIYGPVRDKDINRKTSGSLIARVIKYGIEHKQLKLFKNRNCYRDYVYIDDIVKAFIKTGLANDDIFDGRFFVVGSNKLTTISDMWNTIASVLTDVTVTEDDTIDLNPIEMRSYVGDYRLLEEVIGWQPRVNLQDGVKLTVESLK